jgi:hypothetical protein
MNKILAKVTQFIEKIGFGVKTVGAYVPMDIKK